MVERDTEPESGYHQIAFESFGVRVSVASSNAAQMERVRQMLPPGWKPISGDDVDKRFTFEQNQLERWVLHRDGTPVTKAGLGPEHVLMLFESQVRSFIALTSPDLIFVHAGVVALDDALLVLPGLSFAGKTTLVAALVRAGAIYYSDEYAPIDAEGRVHPYPRILSLRNPDRTRVDVDVATFGGESGVRPLPISRIVVTSYKPGSPWNPRELSAGEAVLALLSHTVPAQSRPEQAMRHLKQAVNGATAFETARGESDQVAQILLDELRR